MQSKAVAHDFSVEQLVPYFQPIFDLNIHKVSRYECLSRLVTANDNIYYPNEFLNIVSRDQSNSSITQRMLELSAAYCIPRNMPCSINMFYTDVFDSELKSWLREKFANYQTNLLGIELSFESVREQPYMLHSLIKEMPSLYTTVEEVTQLDKQLKSIIACGVDAIKVSAQKVNFLSKHQSDVKNLKSLIDYCKEKHCTLVVEDIENHAILEKTIEMGIEFGQGFYLSKPSGCMKSLKQV